MKIKFLGATQTVTGSKYLVTSDQTKVLVDCGLFQGYKHLRLRNWEPFPAQDLNAVVITHAHLDHSGAIPLLIKSGYKGPIFCSPATLDLCKILLPDAGYLQEEEAKFANKHGFSKHKPALPLFTQADAESCVKYLRPIDFGQQISVSETVSIQLYPAGHLLGAASVRVKNRNSSILFSGDLGRSNDPITVSPATPDSAETVVIESTYGNRLHEDKDASAWLADIIQRTVKRGGTILVPSFAVGRAQLLLHLVHRLKIRKMIPDIPVFLNSPMAAQANEIFVRYAHEHRLSAEDARAACAGARTVKSVEESIALNANNEPKIIIAASGMAVGGRILHHLKAFAPDPKNTLVFTGFQAGGTRGDTIVKGASEVKIHGSYWPVRAEVVNLDVLSAHADRNELIAWISKISPKPKRVFVTHGELAASDALRHAIEEKLGVQSCVPEPSQEFEF